MLFVREEIPSKLLTACKQNSSVENIFIEINLRSKKWLLSCPYNPYLTLLNKHIQNMSRGLDVYSPKYDNFMILGDFNVKTPNTTIYEFWTTYNLKNLIKEPTCFKSLETQLVLTLSWQIGQNVFKTQMLFKLGFTISNKLTFTVLKAYFQEQKPKVIKYQNYKTFDINLFRSALLNELLSKNVQIKHLNSFKATAQYIFDRYAPVKEKHVRCNQVTFVNKNLRKAIVTSQDYWINLDKVELCHNM